MVTDDYRDVAEAHRPRAARHRVRHADGAPLGEPLRRAVRGHLAARAHPELSARLRAVLGLRRRQPLGDLVNQTQVLGLEHHLIETFGPRGQGSFAEAAPEGSEEPATQPIGRAATGMTSAPRACCGRDPLLRAQEGAHEHRDATRASAASRGSTSRAVLAAREHVGG